MDIEQAILHMYRKDKALRQDIADKLNIPVSVVYETLCSIGADNAKNKSASYECRCKRD